MSLNSCGGGSNSLLSAIVSRLIIGSITGDFLGIASILATSAAGTTFSAAVTGGAFSMAVNAGTSYTISALNAGGTKVATLKYPRAPGNPVPAFDTVMNVTASTTSALNKKDIDLGKIDVSTRDANNFIVPANNPLAQNDLDEDGLNDFVDRDDNGNGIPDDQDKDDNSDGIDDSKEETT